jgi:DNA-binding MarR family transcriptional regulator
VSTPSSELVANCSLLMRQNSSYMLVLHQGIAESLGLGPTDLKCLDLVRGESDLTASHVAKATGLSTSAVTALLDRLENAGLITRERDLADRRRIFIRPAGRQDEIARAFAPLGDATTALLRGCSTSELEFMQTFLEQLNSKAQELLATT